MARAGANRLELPRRQLTACDNPHMEITDFIETLRSEGALLAAAAEKAGLEAPVPPCPGWQVRDLVRHTGAVHRWATQFVAEGRTVPVSRDDTAPEDTELRQWYLDSLERLADALATAPADLECWSFLEAPSPLAFWARRQVHEVTIHRVDAQTAAGPDCSPVDTRVAADGVDELLAGFHGKTSSKVRTPEPRTLRVRAVDADDDWLMRLSPQSPVTERGGSGHADCTISGTAMALYLAMWNRGPYEALEVSGDASLLDLWRRTSSVG